MYYSKYRQETLVNVQQTNISVIKEIEDRRVPLYRDTRFYSFLPLDYPQQKRKSPVKSLPPFWWCLQS
ncbi:cysteine-rich KTR domain-containing protein [Clostridium neonatale]|uniref:cysteine-rich KTR domain-containing protein n=1 Tax=Clostridium neonatale TaxID=137838 RepID=UPI001FF932F9|nr:cysteine-rich KTR domain-containing protein [Clostridium neonatale]